ncbi:MAG TPA: tRNA (adenosine(37)-N6)-threonylcarbamoyltransferase complex ATPase subunit type 1 TsaE [Acidimicrobiales bacterium]|nr:tRNA (adenosine(37)-N6)-threonylcarbamoyltransferase complex ATPase subunit type 1 TsaE [Acidimicrobiales bacterium]
MTSDGPEPATRSASEGPEPATWSVSALSTGADATRALAASLAPVCRVGDVVLLVGGLGAGKTTFAQGFARGLGVAGPVTSPTFTLVRQYPCALGGIRQLLHADVYRLESTAEVADLGLAELVEDDGVALVEWGDAAAPVLGDSSLTVTLRAEPSGDGGLPLDTDVGDEVRRVLVQGRGPAWADRSGPVQSALAGFAPGTPKPAVEP